MYTYILTYCPCSFFLIFFSLCELQAASTREKRQNMMYTDACWRMLTYVDVCTSVGVCARKGKMCPRGIREKNYRTRTQKKNACVFFSKFEMETEKDKKNINTEGRNRVSDILVHLFCYFYCFNLARQISNILSAYIYV